MGVIVAGRCPCGLEALDLYCETGYTFGEEVTSYLMPYICECGHIGTSNVIGEMPKCRKCGGTSLNIAGKPNNPSQSWPVSSVDEIERSRTQHVCPQCHQQELVFWVSGMWD